VRRVFNFLSAHFGPIHRIIEISFDHVEILAPSGKGIFYVGWSLYIERFGRQKGKATSAANRPGKEQDPGVFNRRLERMNTDSKKGAMIFCKGDRAIPQVKTRRINACLRKSSTRLQFSSCVRVAKCFSSVLKTVSSASSSRYRPGVENPDTGCGENDSLARPPMQQARLRIFLPFLSPPLVCARG